MTTADASIAVAPVGFTPPVEPGMFMEGESSVTVTFDITGIDHPADDAISAGKLTVKRALIDARAQASR